MIPGYLRRFAERLLATHVDPILTSWANETHEPTDQETP